MKPAQLAKLLVVRARLEQAREVFEQPRIKAAIARTKGSGRMGTHKGDKYFVDRLADSVDRMLYDQGLSGVTRWKRKDKPPRGKRARPTGGDRT